MALKISDSRSFKLQPLKRNNWVFQFSAIPGNTSEQPEALAFVAKSCNAPEFSTESPIEIKRMNETYKFAGSPTWADINCSFYDFIRNTDGGNELSAGDILYNWSCMVYNPLTGQMGYKTQYATSATLAQLDPAGNIVRAWNIFGIWPQSVKYGELDYTSNEACEITATFKYDLAIKISDSKTSTESA